MKKPTLLFFFLSALTANIMVPYLFGMPSEFSNVIWSDKGPQNVGDILKNTQESVVYIRGAHEAVNQGPYFSPKINLSPTINELCIIDANLPNTNIRIEAQEMTVLNIENASVGALNIKAPKLKILVFSNLKSSGGSITPERIDYVALSNYRPQVGSEWVVGDSFTVSGGEYPFGLQLRDRTPATDAILWPTPPSGRKPESSISIYKAQIERLSIEMRDTDVVRLHIEDTKADSVAVDARSDLRGAPTQFEVIDVKNSSLGKAFECVGDSLKYILRPVSGIPLNSFTWSHSSCEVLSFVGKLPPIVSISESTIDKGIDLLRSDFSQVESLKLVYLSTDSAKLFLNPDQIDALKFTYRGGADTSDEKTASYLADSFTKRGLNSAADAVRLRIEEAKTNATNDWSAGRVVRKAWGIFFGYGYEAWRWLCFMMIPSALLACCVLWRWFRNDISKISERERGKEAEPFEQLSHNIQMFTCMWLAFRILFSLKFDIKWLTKNTNFNRVIVVVYTAGIAMYVLLFVGARGSLFESAKHLAGF